jgi:hypothetical protein
MKKKAPAMFIENHVRARLNHLMIKDHTLRDFLYRALQFLPNLRPSIGKLAQHPFLPSV